MKLPSFRLYEVQATASLLIAMLGLLCVVILTWCVLRGFDAQDRVVRYDPAGGLGQYRRALVFGFTAITLLVGVSAGLLGFNSLGQKRNSRQGHSWLGMTIGALVVAAAPILFFAWQVFSEPIIHDLTQR
jgi:formate hydrogenlyase subunit 3/multisubunit Na+/H+ antiporter MnhD subunit